MWLKACVAFSLHFFGKLVKQQWWLGIPGKPLGLLCPDLCEDGQLSALDLAFVLEEYFALLLLFVFAWQSRVWDVELGQRDKRNNEALTSHCCHYSNAIFHLGNKELKCLFCVCVNRINIYAVKWLWSMCWFRFSKFPVWYYSSTWICYYIYKDRVLYLLRHVL